MRNFAILFLVVSLLVPALAVPTAEELIERSNMTYYVPALSVASCEIKVPAFADNPDLVGVRYFYTYDKINKDHIISIEGLSESKEAIKGSIEAFLYPIVESAFPVSPSIIADGKHVEMIGVEKRIVDRKAVPFYRVLVSTVDEYGKTISEDVLLLMTETGLIVRYDMEMIVSSMRVSLSYSIMNQHTDRGYLMSHMIGRTVTGASTSPNWQDEQIYYASVDDFLLPTKYERKNLNIFNQTDIATGITTVYFEGWNLIR